MFSRFPRIVHLKHVNNSHKVNFGAFEASLILAFVKESGAYGEEGKEDLFVTRVRVQ